jgi:rubrerythrin
VLKTSWWRRLIGRAPKGYSRALELLCARYVEERQHADRLNAQAGRMHYPQFRDELLDIAAQEAEHADWIAEKIRLLGGKLPEVPQHSVEKQNSWRYLLDDLEEERRCTDELFDDIRRIPPNLPSVTALLSRIHEDEVDHRRRIREMLMRSDPQALWPA